MKGNFITRPRLMTRFFKLEVFTLMQVRELLIRFSPLLDSDERQFVADFLDDTKLGYHAARKDSSRYDIRSL